MAGEEAFVGGLAAYMREVQRFAAAAQIRWTELLQQRSAEPAVLAQEYRKLMDHLDALTAAGMEAHAAAGVRLAEERAKMRSEAAA